MLESTTPIKTPKHSFKNFDEARRWAKANIVGTYKNNNTGEDMAISNVTIGKYLSQKAVEKSVNRDAHVSVLITLPQLVKTAILKEVTPDQKNSKNIREVRRLYGVVNYEENLYSVKLTVKVLREKRNNVYSYEVVDMKNPD
jgi:predicted nucleic acid binding AN1-type Zn finger protein